MVLLVYLYIVQAVDIDSSNKYEMRSTGGGVVELLTRRTSNLRIASHMGSNPVRDKPLFPRARNFTLILIYSTGWFQERIRVSIS